VKFAASVIMPENTFIRVCFVY